MPRLLPRSLKGLLLTYETALLLLVIVTGAMGGLWTYFWWQSSRESGRLNALLFDAQQIRGDLYSQLRLVNRSVRLGEPVTTDTYEALAGRIDERFTDLNAHLDGYREQVTANFMRRTYDAVRVDLARLAGQPGRYAPARHARILDPLYEEWMLAEFESAHLIFIRVLADQRQALEERSNYWTALAPWLIALPVILALLLVLLSRYSLQRGFVRPLRELVTGVRRLGETDPAPTLPERGVTEVAGLARTINQLSSDLAASRAALVASERQAALGALVPVVAHNIRNPLASIRAAAQLIDGNDEPHELLDTRAEIIDTVDRLERWVGALLNYLHPLRLRRRRAALDAIVEGALRPLVHKLTAKDLQLRRAPWPQPVAVAVDPELLEQAVYGLLNNAVEASPHGADLGLGLYLDNNRAELWLEDRGPGLPFEPEPGSLRPGPSTKRFGTGLGIPFAFKVVQAHGGGLYFDPRPGGGTRVRLLLPRGVTNDE